MEDGPINVGPKGERPGRAAARAVKCFYFAVNQRVRERSGVNQRVRVDRMRSLFATHTRGIFFCVIVMNESVADLRVSNHESRCGTITFVVHVLMPRSVIKL